MSDTPLTDRLYVEYHLAPFASNPSPNVIWDLARKLERERAELIEALRYWLPDETSMASDDPRMRAYFKRWNQDVALLARLEQK